jgi:hypothetical protein
VHLAAQIGGVAGRHPVVRARGALLAELGLGQSARPVALELHDLGPVHQAAPAVGHEVGLLIAPPGQRGRPLPRAAEVEGVLAREDHPAVDDPAHDRRQLPRCDRDHALVEQGQALRDTPLLDQEVSLHVNCEAEEVGVAEALRQLGRPGPHRRPRLELAGVLVLEHQGQQQVALLDAVPRLALDQPLGACEPAAGSACLPCEEELNPDPEGTARRAQGLTRFHVALVGPLEHGDRLLVAAQHVGRGRQQLEVLRPERLRAVSVRQRFVGAHPRLCRIELTPAGGGAAHL